MADLLGFVLSGLVSGALYALLATGLVLSYSASGLFNFAHGATAYLCALGFYELHSGFGWPAIPTALLLVFVIAPGLGWALDRLMFRKLARVGETAQIVATIGLLVALPALGLWVVELLEEAGASVKPAENQFGLPGVGPSPAESWQLMDGVGIDSDQLITWVATAVVAVGLWILMRHTPLGLRLRASVDNRSLVELRGISADRLSSLAWMLSSGLAGLAGVLATPLLGLSSHDFTLFLFVSATAAVLGRFMSIPLAFAGGLGLGVLQNLVAGYASFADDITGFRTAVPFLILFAGLLILTRRQRTAGTAAVDAPPIDYLAGKSWAHKWGPWAVAAVLLALAFYTVTTPFWSGILAQGLAISLVFISFTVVTGLGAMVSLAQATFVTGAAMVAGLLMSHGWPFIGAALVGTCVAAVLGALVALPALRLGGRSLALATLALAFLADQVLFQMGWLRNGDTGWEIPRPVFGPVDLTDDRAMGVAMVVLVVAAVAAVSALRDSPSGRAMLAVRSAPAAAMASGVSVVRTKLMLFTLSAGLAGFGGVMYASYQTRITATDFTAMTGLIWLAVVVAAGVRRPQFAVVAGLVFAVMPPLMSDYVTESAHLPVILFGLAGLALANDPDGYAAAASVRRHRRKAAASSPAPDGGARPADPAPTATDAALQLRGVRAGYDGAPVLTGVDLAVRPGEILALLGPNGAGKSTTCKVAAGLLSAQGGTVYVAGHDATRHGAVRRARAGVVLAPEGRGIFPSLTIEENLALHLPDKAAREAVYARFPRLAERRKVTAGSLSGGEQQMLALAPLLQDPPKVLIADEPSLGLAPRVVDEVFQLLTELRDAGTALLLVEEKAAEILGVADTVAYLSQGKVTWCGPRSEVQADRLTEAYLGIAGAKGSEGPDSEGPDSEGAGSEGPGPEGAGSEEQEAGSAGVNGAVPRPAQPGDAPTPTAADTGDADNGTDTSTGTGTDPSAPSTEVARP
ncbi:ABC transporter permease subunit [Streptomyces indicus]|uniref:ABC-type branched-chain amino acid transport system, ATPase component n=1 Tax=Streptomyces indicus TaxID=417292 RepID=A0A1G8UGI5_9ACTN|nr:ATP-binding cassette domain-containing protein [Streptomyces indicus]SDJ52754.1 ABC-type branched-chain amino acid transport system, ATPase component [Streptomyces indicus]